MTASSIWTCSTSLRVEADRFCLVISHGSLSESRWIGTSPSFVDSTIWDTLKIKDWLTGLSAFAISTICCSSLFSKGPKHTFSHSSNRSEHCCFDPVFSSFFASPLKNTSSFGNLLKHPLAKFWEECETHTILSTLSPSTTTTTDSGISDSFSILDSSGKSTSDTKFSNDETTTSVQNSGTTKLSSTRCVLSSVVSLIPFSSSSTAGIPGNRNVNISIGSDGEHTTTSGSGISHSSIYSAVSNGSTTESPSIESISYSSSSMSNRPNASSARCVLLELEKPGRKPQSSMSDISITPPSQGCDFVGIPAYWVSTAERPNIGGFLPSLPCSVTETPILSKHPTQSLSGSGSFVFCGWMTNLHGEPVFLSGWFAFSPVAVFKAPWSAFNRSMHNLGDFRGDQEESETLPQDCAQDVERLVFSSKEQFFCTRVFAADSDSTEVLGLDWFSTVSGELLNE